jgi:hypothetical protein
MSRVLGLPIHLARDDPLIGDSRYSLGPITNGEDLSTST